MVISVNISTLSISAHRRKLVSVIIASFLSLFPFFSISAELNNVLKETQWSDLVPELWEAPLLQAAPDEHDSLYVDPDSLVTALEKTSVKLPGFMIPVTVENYKVTAFILVPFLEHHIKAHIHHDPNQMVFVTLDQPLEITKPFQPLWVSGNILLKAVETDEGPTGYSIENASAEEYLY